MPPTKNKPDNEPRELSLTFPCLYFINIEGHSTIFLAAIGALESKLILKPRTDMEPRM